jgi:cyclase
VLRPRIIPCLLVRNKGLVKTVRFREGKYVGDPINAVRIFNEKEADELMVLDIDATATGSKPDMKMIRFWAAECRMPLCYGGGVKTVEEAKTIIGLGVEKVALSAAALENPALVTAIAKEVGNQSVVVVLDVKSTGGSYEIWTHNATRNTGKCPVDFSRKLQAAGVGEIVLNSIDHDGEMRGYDFKIAGRVREAVTVPMSVLGGAGSLTDVCNLIQLFGIIGAAAGSLFVFKGVYKAVLINYPNPTIKDQIIRDSLAKLSANATP